MALLKTIPDESVMKKYLDESFILPIILNHKENLSRPCINIKRFHSEHIKLLSAQSYLVKYTLTVANDDTTTYTLVLRGNRISKEAAAMWQYLYMESEKINTHVVPTPLQYFPEDNFMLYEELQGKTLRDYDDKFLHLKKVTPELAKHLAWIHSLPILETVGTHTLDDEKQYWQSVVEKINTYHPEKPNWLDRALDQIHTHITSSLKTQLFTPCHNDFQASNLIYNEQSDHVGIIDFGNSTIYTPTIDIATYLVHLSVMTTKHLEQEQIHMLQRLFLESYLNHATKKIKKQVLTELPLYIARVSADIIATTAVALSHTKNPYRILIPKILLPVVKEKTALIKKQKHTIKDCIITIVK